MINVCNLAKCKCYITTLIVNFEHADIAMATYSRTVNPCFLKTMQTTLLKCVVRTIRMTARVAVRTEPGTSVH